MPPTLQEQAIRLLGDSADWNPLLQRIGAARFVLIGEASHGTHEFYAARAAITRRLIEDKGFCAVAVEADWPDAYRVNQFVRHISRDKTAEESLRGFERFPSWMWRNENVVEFVSWLHDHNRSILDAERKVGFYGIDLYSLHRSRQAVIDYLDAIDPEGAKRARFRYSCFDHFGEDTQAYGYAAGFGLSESCESEVVAQLKEMQHRAAELAHRDGRLAYDAFFYAEQNARLVANAERYYRSMFSGRVSSWNLRDRHMQETLEALEQNLSQHFDPPKIIVWAHNSHLGDARATEMSERGELNVGQLARERWQRAVYNIGFTTDRGTVTAATEWGGPAETKRVRPALPGSYAAMFHRLGIPRFLMFPGDAGPLLRESRLERAIGVIYRPETERISHYFFARLADQFNAVIHIDETTALKPLDRIETMDMEESPETYPSGV